MKKIMFIIVFCSVLTACGNSAAADTLTADVGYHDTVISDLNVISTEHITVLNNSFAAETNAAARSGLKEFVPEISSTIKDEICFTGSGNDNKEIIGLFDKAQSIFRCYFKYADSSLFDGSGTFVYENGENYTYTGVSFESFSVYIRQYFTDAYADKLLYGTEEEYYPPKYIDRNGELCAITFSGAVPPEQPESISADISDITGTEKNITVTAYYADDLSLKAEYILKLTVNGWRIDSISDLC